MKTYETIEERLNAVIALLSELCVATQDRTKNCDDVRVKMAFDYLYNHQRHLSQGLERYLKDSSDSLLSTWLPYTLNNIPEPSQFLADLNMQACTTLESVTEIGQQINNYITSHFDAGNNANPELCDAFDNLRLMMITERKQLSRAMNLLSDI